MSLAPALSVVLTTYRRARELPATLDSILGQACGDFELIVSDDCSPDETPDVCHAYASRDRRVRYRRNSVNLNMPGNLNAALREARAPLVANLHDGDVYRPDLLKRWKEALDGDPQAAFVFNACTTVDAEGKATATYSHAFEPRLERGKLVEYMLGRFTGTAGEATRVTSPEGRARARRIRQRLTEWLAGPFGSPVWGTVMARRELYERAGWFDPRFGFISDVDMWLRLNAEHPVRYIAEPLIALGPRGTDRPHSRLNWRVERALHGIFEACAERTFRENPSQAARHQAAIRRARDRRWLFLAVSALRHGELAKAGEGFAMLRAEAGVAVALGGALGGAFTTTARWLRPR